MLYMNNISENSIRRLPRYLRLLEKLREEGVTKISSSELSRKIGFTASQIRQDFSHFGKFGQKGYGYNVDSLESEISEVLGMERGYKVIVIGIGNLGKALMCNFSFEQSGMSIAAAFDTNSEIIGKELNGTVVRHISKLNEFLSDNKADIAILCVPKSAVNEITELLAKTDINAVWNFTNQELSLPENKIVENIHFSDSLLALSYRLSAERE